MAPASTQLYPGGITMNSFTRRRFLRATGAAALSTSYAGTLLTGSNAFAQSGKILTIAYNVALPSWDPTTGPSAVNPTIQSFYKAVFDSYIDQNADLSFKPGLLTRWGWNKDRTRVEMEVRRNAFWHDGTPVTPADVAWSLERAGDQASGNPIQFVWGKIGNFRIDGQTITGDVKEFEPALFKWMAFLTGYVLPQKAYTAAGAAGWENKPIGSGPYMVEKFERNAYIRLKAFPKYWGSKPQFEVLGNLVGLDVRLDADLAPHSHDRLNHFVILGLEATRCLDGELHRLGRGETGSGEQVLRQFRVVFDRDRRIVRRVLRRLQGVNHRAIASQQLVHDRFLVDGMDHRQAHVLVQHRLAIGDEDLPDVRNRVHHAGKSGLLG